MQDSGKDRLAAGREALRRHAWREAFEQLGAADAAAPLQPEDLERLAEAAQWIGRLDDCIAVHERAHTAHLERGDQRRAGFVALLLTHDHFAKGQASLANAWMRRAERLLDAERDSIEYGHLLRARGLLAKDPDEALAHARAAHELATRLGDHDLAARQVQELGRLLVAKGEVAEGLALIEDATVTAVSGALGPLATGDIFCTAIDVCRRLADYGRASEWTDAARHWCDRQGILGFPGSAARWRTRPARPPTPARSCDRTTWAPPGRLSTSLARSASGSVTSWRPRMRSGRRMSWAGTPSPA